MALHAPSFTGACSVFLAKTLIALLKSSIFKSLKRKKKERKEKKRREIEGKNIKVYCCSLYICIYILRIDSFDEATGTT